MGLYLGSVFRKQSWREAYVQNNSVRRRVIRAGLLAVILGAAALWLLATLGHMDRPFVDRILPGQVE